MQEKHDKDLADLAAGVYATFTHSAFIQIVDTLYRYCKVRGFFGARELASQAPLQVQKDTKAAAAAPAPAPASAAPTEEEEKNQDGSVMSRR